MYEFNAGSAELDEVIKALIQSGGVVLRGLLSTEILDRIENNVRPFINADKPWKGDFFPPETRRVCGLGGKSHAFMENVVGNALYQGVCNDLLTSTHHSYYGQKLEQSVSHPQLNNTIVFSIGPGARNQELHRDDMVHHNQLPAISADKYESGRDTGIGFL